MKNLKHLTPFKYFCMTIGNLPTSYVESMSYYETLCWLCKYLENTVIPTVNNNSLAVEELQEYVTNYFDNLDYQTEVNKKLDEMAEDGTLAEIINVEMLGSLEDLTTTDKSDLVSAVNEVNSNTITNASAISNVSDEVGTLSNLTTTDKSDLVSAVNEVDNNSDSNATAISNLSDEVGTLSNLTTTDKSDIVSAVNEVNENVNLLNLTNFTAYNIDNVYKTNYSSGFGTLHVASNNDGSVGKIYGYFGFIASDNTQNSTFSIQTSLRPNESINIDGSLIVVGSAGGTGGYIQVRTTGEVVITIYPSNNTTLMSVTIPPCLYFMKNFGD